MLLSFALPEAVIPETCTTGSNYTGSMHYRKQLYKYALPEASSIQSIEPNIPCSHSA